ncbi:MAG: transposase [Legionellales bacterium]|nr:transposase [Legionellales bacterium]
MKQLNKSTIKLSLYQAIASLKNTTETMDFLHDLCTPAELQAMSDRWQVVVPIVQGMPYRQISEETGVSVTTVGRVARCLRYGSGAYLKILKRIKKGRAS